MTTRARVIGGVFALEPLASLESSADRRPADRRFVGALRFVNARSAVAAVIARTRPRTVWAPSYLCASLVTGLAGRPGPRLRFYDVGDTLVPRDDRWLSDVTSGSLVVLIDFFGIPVPRVWVRRAHARGALVLEDAAGALLTSGIGRGADFCVTSPRKFAGVPDGAYLHVAEPSRWSLATPRRAPPARWLTRALDACQGRARFDVGRTDERGWFAAYQQSENEAPCGAFAMSATSRARLERAVNWRTVARRRRRAYRRFASALGRWALWPRLPRGVVPLGFPMRVNPRQRDALRRWLFAHDVFPPVHWPIAGVVPARFQKSHALSRAILTLPCDQRLADGDVDRVIDRVRAFHARRG